MNIHQWAINAAPSSSSQKLLLLVLANNADESGQASSTFEQIEEESGLTIKTIRKNLNALVDQGLIEDTGKRVGLAGTTKVWQLAVTP